MKVLTMTHILTLCQRSPHSSRLSLNFTPKMSESTWDQRGPHFSSWRFSPLPPPPTKPGGCRGRKAVDRNPSPCQPGSWLQTGPCVLSLPPSFRDFVRFPNSSLPQEFVTGTAEPDRQRPAFKQVTFHKQVNEHIKS